MWFCLSFCLFLSSISVFCAHFRDAWPVRIKREQTLAVFLVNIWNMIIMFLTSSKTLHHFFLFEKTYTLYISKCKVSSNLNMHNFEDCLKSLCWFLRMKNASINIYSGIFINPYQISPSPQTITDESSNLIKTLSWRIIFSQRFLFFPIIALQ